MKSLPTYITTAWIAEAAGVSPLVVSNWRKRGVPERYQPAVKSALAGLGGVLVRDYGQRKADMQEPIENVKLPDWEFCRDVVTAQLIDEGLDADYMVGGHVDDSAFWLKYMTDKNWQERLAKHEAKEKPA